MSSMRSPYCFTRLEIIVFRCNNDWFISNLIVYHRCCKTMRKKLSTYQCNCWEYTLPFLRWSFRVVLHHVVSTKSTIEGALEREFSNVPGIIIFIESRMEQNNVTCGLVAIMKNTAKYCNHLRLRWVFPRKLILHLFRAYDWPGLPLVHRIATRITRIHER